MAGFLSVERISALAVELLGRSIVLPGTVQRVPGADYAGSGGKTIVRVPRRRVAQEYEASITYGSIDEFPVEVNLVRWFDGVQISTAEATLDIVDFGRQVLSPMIQGIAEAGENCLADVMNAVEPASAWTDLDDADKTRSDLLLIREQLTQNNVPAGNRTLAVSPEVASGILRVPEFVKANEAGSPDALRNASIGRVYGMDCVESNALEAGSAVAYHRSGFAFATLAPAAPQGGASVSTQAVDGVSCRCVLAYDTASGQDTILVDTYGGAAMITDPDDDDSGDESGDGQLAKRVIRVVNESS
jgi:hypothetical protein